MKLPKVQLNGWTVYPREVGANRSTRRKPPTTSPKLGMTLDLLEVKIHRHPLTLVVSSLGQKAPALKSITQ